MDWLIVALFWLSVVFLFGGPVAGFMYARRNRMDGLTTCFMTAAAAFIGFVGLLLAATLAIATG